MNYVFLTLYDSSSFITCFGVFFKKGIFGRIIFKINFWQNSKQSK